MEELVSMIVANGLWATLFCILLAYELKDSRRRESRYTETINMLSEKLGVIKSVKADTVEIKSDVEAVRSDTEEIKVAVSRKKSSKNGGAPCVQTV